MRMPRVIERLGDQARARRPPALAGQIHSKPMNPQAVSMAAL
jgi:hypothetical protein